MTQMQHPASYCAQNPTTFHPIRSETVYIRRVKPPPGSSEKNSRNWLLWLLILRSALVGKTVTHFLIKVSKFQTNL